MSGPVLTLKDIQDMRDRLRATEGWSPCTCLGDIGLWSHRLWEPVRDQFLAAGYTTPENCPRHKTHDRTSDQ